MEQISQESTEFLRAQQQEEQTSSDDSLIDNEPDPFSLPVQKFVYRGRFSIGKITNKFLILQIFEQADEDFKLFLFHASRSFRQLLIESISTAPMQR
jgi:hypothetical protein